jgi:hypothetical protein
MEIFAYNKSGDRVSVEDYLQRLEDAIINLQVTVLQLEYEIKNQKKEVAEEINESDYNKFREEIMEEVNLIITDLL